MQRTVVDDVLQNVWKNIRVAPVVIGQDHQLELRQFRETVLTPRMRKKCRFVGMYLRTRLPLFSSLFGLVDSLLLLFLSFFRFKESSRNSRRMRSTREPSLIPYKAQWPKSWSCVRGEHRLRCMYGSCVRRFIQERFFLGCGGLDRLHGHDVVM